MKERGRQGRGGKQKELGGRKEEKGKGKCPFSPHLPSSSLAPRGKEKVRTQEKRKKRGKGERASMPWNFIFYSY